MKVKTEPLGKDCISRALQASSVNVVILMFILFLSIWGSLLFTLVGMDQSPS